MQYGIAPARKQYAELTPEATGFQLQRLMTPGQLVQYLERLRGIEFVGEEPLAGRTALKYRYARTAQTQTSAGEVKPNRLFMSTKIRDCLCVRNFSARPLVMYKE